MSLDHKGENDYYRELMCVWITQLYVLPAIWVPLLKETIRVERVNFYNYANPFAAYVVM